MEGNKVSQRYMRRLTETEINNYRKEVADLSIEAEILEEDFQVVKDDLKAKLKPIKKAIRTALHLVRYKQIEDIREVYLVPNYNTGKMEIVDLTGDVIEKRNLTPDEMQVSLELNN